MIPFACRPVRWFAPTLALVMAACGGEPGETSGNEGASAASASQAAVQETDLPETVYWGDTHTHTGNSFDVYLFGTPTSTPETAFRFARGEAVESPTTGEQWQLSRPLDFLVVADHAEMLGTIAQMYAGEPGIADTESGEIFRAMAPSQTEEELQEVYDQMTYLGAGDADKASVDLTPEQMIADLDGERRRGAWERYLETVERFNEPGTFTALIGWEWSSTPGGSNLHRVVFMPQDATVGRQFLPYSSLDSRDPQDLWDWLDVTSRETGAEFIAIPHGSNISMGRFFPLETLDGEPIDAEYARTRSRWEPAVEVTQIKGDSETHPLLSPTDEFADFESYNFALTPDGTTPEPTEGDYARSGLKRGLQLEAEVGANPFKFGMIGSTDAHTGMPAVEEDNFAGKGQHDATPEQRPHPTGIGSSLGWDMGAAGFAGVWATANTRQAIADAFARKEVYASTGPRITLRFFGGFDFTEAEAAAGNMAEVGYARGVPMGGDLGPSETAPTFLVAAMKDPDYGNLDRMQIVKGWLNPDGSTGEQVYDVALSDGRTDGGQLVGNTVELATGEYTNDIGATELVTWWQDPDFDPEQSAFYYARVLQIPTPRYSLYDAIELGIDPSETGRPATIQERVYSSPIWYNPEG